MIGDGKTGSLEKIKSTNKETLNDEVTLALRAITEKRATTMTYMIDKAEESDKFARDSVRQYGVDNGTDFKKILIDSHDLKEFAEKFTEGLESNVYEMETVKATDDEFEVHFHYCPYVNRWLKMGKNPKEMSQLCDICMEGDRAMATPFENIDFELGNTIAKGGDFCNVRYIKNNK